MSHPLPFPSEFPFLRGGGELARLIAAHDWSATALGPLERWPEHIKTATALMLRAKVPIVMLWGPLGYMIYNDAYSVFAGGRHPRLLGSEVRKGWPEVAEFNDNVMKVGLAGGNLSYKDQELVLYRSGVGEPVWMDLDYSPMLDERGEPAGVMAVVIETTEKVRARRIVQGERERLARMFEQAPSFMALLEGPSHRVVLANPRYVKLVGREVLDEAIAEALPDAVAQGYTALLDRVFLTGEPYSAVASRYEIQPDPGVAPVVRYVDFVFQPIRDEDGSVSGIFVQGVDVTDRVMAEQALRESEARFRTIADALPQMVWSTLPDGFHDYYNRQWYDYTGVPPGTTDGEGWNDMFHPDDQQHAWDEWRHSLATGDTYEIEYRLRHRSGEYRWVLGRALPVRDAEGRIVRWMGTCTDVHEQKMVREELLANNRRKDEFLAMLAHELRNPLAPISTAAHLLKAAPSDAKYVERSADIIARQVLHMTELVDDLLDVSRVTRGLVELERIPVDLKAVIGNAIEQVRPLIDARGHRLATQIASGDVYVLGDATRLVQVISNLLNNAAKYTPPSGTLTLALSAPEGAEFVEVRIADNGTGIDAQLLPHIFDLFTQGERTPDRQQGGLGLGLSLVRSLVELHGGRVAAESEGRGEGSAFTVTLPRLPAQAPVPAAAATASGAAAAPGALRLMVVDDNRDGAETLGVLLETLGHEVRVAHDAVQALALAESFAADVFILDIGLPGMNGYELARALREQRRSRDAMYIALTGYGGTKDRQRAGEAGFDHHLVKPADLAELARLLDLAK
ncbi:PAS domain-containing protein [Ramlibacter sp.]|uniref:hybrid sensor histidine kinase/response regulator n=1 Tax=Ramlibacter sp. TaxID=1917967 RepID=UPI003D0DA51A